jgi:SAM-dependent methyltransferase
MPRTEPFERHPNRYDQWFDRHSAVFAAEVRVLRALMPRADRGLEVGVGTGRFAQALGVEEGVDPAPKMRRRARQRGLRVRDGTAEDLPYDDDQFDVALLVTTICFVDDVEKSLAEIYRVLAPGGALLVGMVDRESPLGQEYEDEKEEHPFYHTAHFHTATEVVRWMRAVGFDNFAFRQTLFHPLDDVDEREPVKAGHGEGAFIAIRGDKRRAGTGTGAGEGRDSG